MSKTKEQIINEYQQVAVLLGDLTFRKQKAISEIEKEIGEMMNKMLVLEADFKRIEELEKADGSHQSA